MSVKADFSGRVKTMIADDEKLMVLKMVQESKLSPAEGLQLLRTLETSGDTPEDIQGNDFSKAGSSSSAHENTARWFRVRVTNIESGRPKINMRLPIGLVNAGLKMGMCFSNDLDEINMDEIRQALTNGEIGQIVDVTDDQDCERTEIFLE
jgi:hypothetical protein